MSATEQPLPRQVRVKDGNAVVEFHDGVLVTFIVSSRRWRSTANYAIHAANPGCACTVQYISPWADRARKEPTGFRPSSGCCSPAWAALYIIAAYDRIKNRQRVPRVERCPSPLDTALRIAEQSTLDVKAIRKGRYS